MKVLLAEDDAITSTMIENLLGKWGYEVVSVTNGDDAWKILSHPGHPRIAVLDWVMPGLDGITLCRKIRMEMECVVYSILLTGKSGKNEITEGLDAGADDYITKPFDYNELRARLSVGRRFVELQESLERHISQLSDALAHIKTLQGMIPICMYCHKIRREDKLWEKLETYISKHSDAQFSHGICPECEKKYFP